MDSLTPLADCDAKLAPIPTLVGKASANKARIKQVLILYAPPKPSFQTPHHDSHSVTEPEINVGLCDQMDMGRWTQRVSHLYSVAIMQLILYYKPLRPSCPHLCNITGPLGFDILINSEPLSTWILIRREIADALNTE